MTYCTIAKSENSGNTTSQMHYGSCSVVEPQHCRTCSEISITPDPRCGILVALVGKLHADNPTTIRNTGSLTLTFLCPSCPVNVVADHTRSDEMPGISLWPPSWLLEVPLMHTPHQSLWFQARLGSQYFPETIFLFSRAQDLTILSTTTNKLHNRWLSVLFYSCSSIASNNLYSMKESVNQCEFLSRREWRQSLWVYM